MLPLLHRSNFLLTIFDVIPFIKANLVYINGRLVNYVNYTLKVFDRVTFHPVVSQRVKRTFVLKRYKGSFLFNTPSFLFVNYRFLYILLLYKPHRTDLAFPIKLDIYRATGYY